MIGDRVEVNAHTVPVDDPWVSAGNFLGLRVTGLLCFKAALSHRKGLRLSAVRESTKLCV
jgi:hypothetical protein